MHRRLLTTTVLLASLTVAGVVPAAWADRDNRAWTDGAGVGAKASVTEDSPVAPRHSRPDRGPVCRYAPLSPEDSMIADFLRTRDQGKPKHADGGAWYSKICTDDQGNSTSTVAWFWRPPSPPPAGEALAQQVLRYMPLPLPSIEMNPSADRDQLVNLPVWLWLDPAGWKPVSTSASAGGVTVTVQAEPVRVVWAMGDGSTIACGPGTPYDPSRTPDVQSSPCSYAYRHSSAALPGGRYQVTATAEWHATWTVAGDPTGGGDLGVVTRSSTTALRVGEAQAVNTVSSP